MAVTGMAVKAVLICAHGFTGDDERAVGQQRRACIEKSRSRRVPPVTGDGDHDTDSHSSSAAEDVVRNEILASALYDWVPLAELDSIIINNHLTETLPALQDLALRPFDRYWKTG